MPNERINFKHTVLKKVAQYAYEGTLEQHKPLIPLEIIPHNSTPTYRCCIYREREILRNRVDWACGVAYVPDGSGTNVTDEVIAVMNSACEGCPLQRYTVTSNCHRCMAQRCMEACRFGAITMTHNGAVIDPDKCRECGMCASACPYNAISDARRPCVRSCAMDAITVDQKNRRAWIDYSKCISCGNCTVACPFSAISDTSMITEVIADFREGKEVYACFAPSIEGQFGDANVGKLIEAIRQLGFKDCYEVALGADATAYAEAQEVKEAAEESRRMTTSCCPAFYNMVAKKFPELLPMVSHTVSPMVATARFIKAQHPDAKVAFFGPCMAKKSEVKRYRKMDAVGADYALTYEELEAMFAAKDIDPADISADGVQQGSLHGKNFAVSGGVAAAVQQVLAEEEFEHEVTCLKCGSAAECKKALQLLKAGRINETVIEGMICEGGCVNGPGKITDVRTGMNQRKQLLAGADGRSIRGNLAAAGFEGIDMQDHR